MSGCSRPRQSLPASVNAIEISPQPPQVGPITVTFHLEDAAKPVTGARTSLEADMTHAGMAPVFGDAREIAPGQYQGRLVLSMGGDWVVLMHIVLPNGQKLEKQIAVGGVQNK
ncbi:MAG: FixH family protein [Terriglobales bacterium]